MGTGFLFHDLTDSALYDTICWACDLYYKAPETIRTMRKCAMHQDFSWNTSAKKYIDVYRWAKKY
jgi:starch synthase